MKALKHLNKYFIKYKWRLLLGISFIVISKIFAVYPAKVIRKSFDTVSESIKLYQLFNGFHNQEALYEILGITLLYFGIIVIVVALLNGFFLFLTRQTIIIMSRLIEYDLKNEIYSHYQHLSLAFYKRNNTGDLMNRISEDVGKVRMYFGPAIMYTINLIVLFTIVIFTMLQVNVQLTVYCLSPLPILSFTIYYVSNLINKKSEAVQRQLSTISTFVQEAFSGIRVVKAYNRQINSQQEFEKESANYKSISLNLVKTNALFHPIMILLIGFSTISTIYIGGILTSQGEITTGNIAEFVIYVNMLTWPVAASQERINEFLNTKPEILNPSFNTESIKGQIEFKNVSFTYPDTGIKALNNISFKLEKGKSLAIIGKTGSGKSTIANLICRMYDVSQGEILIDSKKVQKLNLNQLRKSIGYVPQEVFLFSDTISNNICFGLDQHKINKSIVEQATKAASVYDNIIEFPKQFDTILGERGITLSGGQKQRLSIARAIIKNPSILIFDDCLSAVDTETEAEIIDNLNQVMKDKTTIIISHRVSSIKQADTIIVIENGAIIEYGNHEKLLEIKGAYYETYNKQLLERQKINDLTKK